MWKCHGGRFEEERARHPLELERSSHAVPLALVEGGLTSGGEKNVNMWHSRGQARSPEPFEGSLGRRLPSTPGR